MDMDMWTSPPLELLLEVFRHLDITDVIRCAGTCKPWRCAIIGNAVSCLRPRPDRFVPKLLIGFVFDKKLNGEAGVSLHRTAGPFDPAFAFPTAGTADLALYNEPLSSRDGLLLLNGREVEDLCLYNTMTGDHTFIPTAAFKADTYVLVTGYDLSPSDDLGVRILAVEVERANHCNTITLRHQQFSSHASAAAAWGPVKRSPEFMKNLTTRMSPGEEVICGGAVHWLGSCP
ncbi:unnamed protein product [Urochloa humidicola]